MTNNSLNIPYIVLSGTVIIGIILAIVIYQPLVSESIQLRSQIEEDTVTLNDKQDQLRNIQSRVNALNSQREHENRLNVVLPQDDSLEDVLRIIHVAVNESGGIIHSINDQSAGVQASVSSNRLRGEGTSVTEDIVPLAFSVSYSGTYRQLRVFLEKIEQSPRLMDVMNLSIRKSGEGEAISASFTIRFYKYNLEELNI